MKEVQENITLHLEKRRANSVKEFLVSMGVDASRIMTVSYGKERPAAEEVQVNLGLKTEEL